MQYVGIDLHKKTIVLCVRNQEGQVVREPRFHCSDPEKIREFFVELGAFQAVVEATASYEWLWLLLEPLANRLVLAHPKKMRVIAESNRKTDRLDARILAEHLWMGKIPEAFHPTPRQREHRTLVRHRVYLVKRLTAVQNKIHRILSNYNADRPGLFDSSEGWEWLKEIKLSNADRFVVDDSIKEWESFQKRLEKTNKELKAFAKKAPVAEQEAREVLNSVPGVGTVTVDVVVSELGDVRRFRSQKKVVAYAGLAPGYRETGGKRKQLRITKEGSPLLRWVLVEAAWRLVRFSPRWKNSFENLRNRCGKKRAIVAIARRLFGVMAALLKKGEKYRLAS
jgi:transposase